MTSLSNYQETLYQEFLRHLPYKWFKQMRVDRSGHFYPLVWAICGALANARLSVECAIDQAIPVTSSGFWLSLHMLGIGLQRRAQENDETALRRYQFEFEHSRNTRAGLLRLLEFYGLTPPEVRLETRFQDEVFGALNVIVNAETKHFNEIQAFDWIRTIPEHYAANGLSTAIDLRLCDLQYAPLAAWTFSTPFHPSWTTLGPLTARPSFISSARLPDSRNQFGYISASDWSAQAARLEELYQDFGRTTPGRKFTYLAECDCKYVCADYQPYLPAALQSLDFAERPFEVLGFQFNDVFPRQGAQTLTNVGVVETQLADGLSPLQSNIFPASPDLPEYAVFPAAQVMLPTPTSFDLPPATLRSLARTIEFPVFYQFAARVFNQLEWFPYDEMSTTVDTAVSTFDVPDYCQVEFKESQPPRILREEYWNVRGNWAAQTVFGLPSADVHALPLATSLRLPVPVGELGAIAFDDRRPVTADFLEFQGYWFPYLADEVKFYSSEQEVSPITGFIPNVRASFTRGWISRFLEVKTPLEERAAESTALDLLANGPWRLKLGTGLTASGRTVSRLLTELTPASLWWTDEQGERVSPDPLVSVNQPSYLAIEFLFSAQQAITLRELELNLGHKPIPAKVDLFEPASLRLPSATTYQLGAAELSDLNVPEEIQIRLFPIFDVVDFRRVEIEMTTGFNFGIIYKIATRFSEIETIDLLAFRTGRSRIGEPLRDRDYTVVAA